MVALMCTSSASARKVACSTSRAVESLSITPPGGAADCMRWAIPHLLTNRGVTQSTRTDLAGDHRTGIQPNPKLQCDAVVVLDFDGEPLGLLLNAQGCQTGTHSVVLKRDWRPEHRHDPVAGELVHRAAITLHHCGSPEIVEGFLCRFRLGLGFPDLVVDRR